MRLDGAKARTGRGVGVESGSGLGERSQRSESHGIMGNVDLERMGAYLDGDQNLAEGLCFPHSLVIKELITQYFFHSQKRCDCQKALSVKGRMK